MGKIKILVDAHVFDGIPQGTLTYLKGIYKHLLQDERFTVFFASHSIKNLKESFIGLEFEFIRLKYHSKLVRLAFEFPYIIKKYNIDIAHFQYIVPPIKFCKYIVTIHDLLFLDFPKQFPLLYRVKNSFLFYISSKLSDGVFTVSNYSADCIKKRFNYKKEIYVTPNGVDLSHVKMSSDYRPLISKYILYVSRIEPRKNQKLLLRAWRELSLAEKGYGLVFVGSVGIKDFEFEERINDLNYIEKSNFRWLQNVSDNDLFSIYQNCELFVYPSCAEGFGIPPLEAAICGKKVICSNSTAMSDFDFFKEYFFDPYDIDSLKTKILEALGNSSFNSHNNITEIKNRYRWDLSADVLSNRIIEIVNK